MLKKRSNTNTENKQRYKNSTAQLKSALNKVTETKERQIINSGNLGSFYRHVNSKLSHKSGVAPLKATDSSLITVYFDAGILINSNRMLKATSAAGPDGLPSTLIKYFMYQLAEQIALSFRLIIQHGNVDGSSTSR